MKIGIISKHKTSVGYYSLANRYGMPEGEGDMAQDDMFLIPQETFDDFATKQGIVCSKEVYEFADDIVKLFELPKVAKSTPGLRVGRLMKFVLQHFYNRLEKQYQPFDEFIEHSTIMAALEIYEQISKRSPRAWLSRNHYQFVSKHDDLKVPSVRNTWLGPFSYTQIRTYYPREGIVLCQWKLGDDGTDEIVVHDEEDGGKRIVNPLLTLDVHRHYTKERTQTLQQIVEEKRITPPSEHSALSVLIRSFYMTRRVESIIDRHSLE